MCECVSACASHRGTGNIGRARRGGRDMIFTRISHWEDACSSRTTGGLCSLPKVAFSLSCRIVAQ